MNFAQVYQKYQIPPNLQQHQLRVAGVAYLITNNWKTNPPIDPKLMAKVGLVHDMGNILKFNLEPKIAQRYGLTDLDKWNRVKQLFRQKYGPDENQATFQICQELGLTKELTILKQINQLYDLTKIANSPHWPLKIAVYADMRVSPDGVVSFKQRLEDFFQRYNLHDIDSWLIAGKKIESQLQSQTKIDITTITESDLQHLYPIFLNWKV